MIPYFSVGTMGSHLDIWGQLYCLIFPKQAFLSAYFHSFFFCLQKKQQGQTELRCFLFPKTHLTVVKSTLTGTQINKIL